MKIATKPLIVGGILGTAGIAALSGANVVSAQTAADPHTSLVEAIAKRFNLNKTDVEEVFDDEREARKEAFEASRSARLQALVDKGSITAEQKSAIEAKIKELDAERESNMDAMRQLTPSERKAKMEEKRTELEKWASDNGINLKNLRGVLGGPHGAHHGGFGMKHEQHHDNQ